MADTVRKPVFLDQHTPPHIMTLVLMAGVSAMSMNIFLPSLPSMAAYYEADPWIVALSVPVYLGVNGVLQLFIGPISDRYGRRPVLLWAVAGFMLATLGTLLAQTVEVFLIFRMAQAVITAGLVLSRAVVRDMVGPNEAASMIGYVTMGMAIVPMVAPMAGGVLDEAFGWKANFWLMLICGGLIFILIWRDLGETATATSTSFAAQVRDYPELLTSRRFWGYCAAAAFASGAFFAYLGGAPFIATDVFGLSPTMMGFYFGAPAVGYAAGNYLSGRYSTRFGLNMMVLTGTGLTLLGMVLLLLIDLSTTMQPAVFFGFFIFVGLGNGLVIPNATAGMLSVRPHLAGTASGLGGAIMIGGGAALSAVAGLLLSPGSGAFPLLLLICVTSAVAVLAILLVIQRERTLGVA
ncbi:multidrug effflux MFS transporter [Actibacterium sp. 188UL27-1]|uniref:multidrug effflux MFS transporter n=1 Tax=Actibacterium sp. 188UL27-1 TaxID=2786961 RepID=UPI001958A66C|nr:multidrug effflux MFS transporter [Actibacterium sp. 188UL27-1]MBM7069572.1 multidrug effflux MFS transporter [Actibacterium sp. 188UL27-1]